MFYIHHFDYDLGFCLFRLNTPRTNTLRMFFNFSFTNLMLC